MVLRGRFLQWRQATIKLPQRLMSFVVHVVNFRSKIHINSSVFAGFGTSWVSYTVYYIWRGKPPEHLRNISHVLRQSSHAGFPDVSCIPAIKWGVSFWTLVLFAVCLSYLSCVSHVHSVQPLSPSRIRKRASVFTDVHFLQLTHANFASCLCTVLFYHLECLRVAE